MLSVQFTLVGTSAPRPHSGIWVDQYSLCGLHNGYYRETRAEEKYIGFEMSWQKGGTSPPLTIP